LHCTARATFIGSQFQILRAIELARHPRLDKPKVLFWMRSKLSITFANNGVGVSIVDQTKREGQCDVAHRPPGSVGPYAVRTVDGCNLNTDLEGQIRIQNDPKPGKNRNSGRPLFPKSLLPVFSLLFAFGEIT
jgi:hypothetical protein